jgi:hypothetical protein
VPRNYKAKTKHPSARKIYKVQNVRYDSVIGQGLPELTPVEIVDYEV